MSIPQKMATLLFNFPLSSEESLTITRSVVTDFLLNFLPRSSMRIHNGGESIILRPTLGRKKKEKKNFFL